jgi:uncharacterized protein YdaU (DUF1376 family)
MNDLYFIDYEPKIMLTDTVGMRPDTELAHRRLCDVLWSQGCPLVHDDISLQDICRSKDHDWVRIKGELMQKGWMIENGQFTHKGCMKTMLRCHERHEKKIAAANAGAAGRWGKKSSEPTCDRNATAMPTDMRPQCQSHSQSQSPVERESNLPEIPPMSRKDFDVMSEMRGVPKECAEWFWNVNDGRGWVDSKSNPIVKVEPLLLNALKSWRTKQARTSGSKFTPPKPTNKQILDQWGIK